MSHLCGDAFIDGETDECPNCFYDTCPNCMEACDGTPFDWLCLDCFAKDVPPPDIEP
jgi:hypothetical protein